MADISYINTLEENAAAAFTAALLPFLRRRKKEQPLALLCIGTDRATGDCLGPITGHLLTAQSLPAGVRIYGTLAKPVHGKNLAAAIRDIYGCRPEPLVVAVDACLGQPDHVGYLSMGEGALNPGAGLKKNLPSVGDFFITGVVNLCGAMNYTMLANTRLHLVMRMAEVISQGIARALGEAEAGRGGAASEGAAGL